MSHKARGPAWVINHRLLAGLDDVHRGLVTAVRDVDRHPDLVHPADDLASEGGEPAIVRLLEA